MASLNNSAQLKGNLGADPEVRYTSKGTAVCNMRVATNERYTDAEGAKQQHTEWHRVVVWGKLAEQCAKSLKKGSACLLTGRIRTRKWTDSNSVDRYVTEIHANQIEFLTRKNSESVEESQEELQESMPF